jgi:phosphatidylinositol-bisphosphatase
MDVSIYCTGQESVSYLVLVTVMDVSIYCTGQESVSYLVLVTGCLSVGKIGESDIFKITTTQFVSLRNNPGDEDRIQEIKKLMNSGTFYFSWSNSSVPWDLTLCAQRKLQDHETDNRFFW